MIIMINLVEENIYLFLFFFNQLLDFYVIFYTEWIC